MSTLCTRTFDRGEEAVAFYLGIWNEALTQGHDLHEYHRHAEGRTRYAQCRHCRLALWMIRESRVRYEDGLGRACRPVPVPAVVTVGPGSAGSAAYGPIRPLQGPVDPGDPGEPGEKEEAHRATHR